MSFVSVAPDVVSAATENLQNVGSALRSVSATAAAQTAAIVAPAADEVSAAITALFGTHAQEFQKINAQAAAFHDEFVNLLNGSAAQYLDADATNAQQMLGIAADAPPLLHGPLIGFIGPRIGEFINSLPGAGKYIAAGLLVEFFVPLNLLTNSPGTAAQDQFLASECFQEAAYILRGGQGLYPGFHPGNAAALAQTATSAAPAAAVQYLQTQAVNPASGFLDTVTGALRNVAQDVSTATGNIKTAVSQLPHRL
jgi:PE family